MLLTWFTLLTGDEEDEGDEGGGEDEKYMTGRRSRLNVVPRIGGRYGKRKDDKLREGVGPMTGGG